MNKRSFTLLLIVIVAALLAAPAWNFKQDKKSVTAWIIKVKNEVERRTPTTGWSKAVTLAELKSGHEVRTQEKSFALIRFADESKVAVREKSVITIQGDVEGRQILNRNVYIERGRAVFDIKKQQTEQFRFTSPISVASIRGTEGGTGFDPSEGEADITIITGVADFQSTVTNCQTSVGAGQTGRVDTTGNCRTEQAKPNDLNNNNPNSNVNQGGEPTPPPGAPKDTTTTTTTRDTTGTRTDTTATQPPPPVKTARFTINKLAGELETGKGARLQIALQNAPVDITNVVLYYRTQGDPSYKQLTMSVSNQQITGTLQGSDIKAGTTKIFEYYLSMQGADGSTYTFPETDPETSPYTLPIKPRIVTLKVPVTDASGNQKFLTITYEE